MVVRNKTQITEAELKMRNLSLEISFKIEKNNFLCIFSVYYCNCIDIGRYCL